MIQTGKMVAETAVGLVGTIYWREPPHARNHNYRIDKYYVQYCNRGNDIPIYIAIVTDAAQME